MTQNERVLSWLQRRNVTAMYAAMHHTPVMRLAARICDLRCKGHNIETEMVTNGRVRYARYRLVK